MFFPTAIIFRVNILLFVDTYFTSIHTLQTVPSALTKGLLKRISLFLTVVFMLLKFYWYYYINLKDGKTKNQRHKVWKGDQTTKIYATTRLPGWAEVHSRGKFPLMQAAFEVGVHYSTAKTILFFHKKQNKAYSSFNFNNTQEPQGQSSTPRATYVPVAISIDCLKTLCPTI